MFSFQWVSRRKREQCRRSNQAVRARRTRLSVLALESKITPVRISSPIVDRSLSGLIFPAQADRSPIWTELIAVPPAPEGKTSYLQVERFLPFTLNSTAMQTVLGQAPLESNVAAPDSPIVVELPKPDGTMAHFRIVNMPMMAPELAAIYPEIQTYRGQGIEDPAATLAADFTPQGFHAQVLSPDGSWYIDPYFHLDTSVYASYFRSDLTPNAPLPCDFVSESLIGPAAIEHDHEHSDESEGGTVALRTGTQLRTYRTAVATTGEYTIFHGGTQAAGQAAVVTAMNRVSGVYELELSIRMTLIANNNTIIYTNPSTDPYTNSSGGTMLSQNQSNLDAVIGNANYDIGHVFSTGGGGVAGLGVVGISGQKARGVTGSPQPIGDPFTIDYVAHEMGHQYRGNHSFNTSSAGGNRNASTAYEPGSGSTIMSYAGITGANSDLQPNSDAYFHSISFDEIINFVDNFIPGVGTRTATGNLVPTVTAVTAGPFTIPTGTPFYLTAAGTDGNGDTLTYNWEQRNLGPANLLNSPDNGSSPLFRSMLSTTNPTRMFPRLSSILNNSNPTGNGEKLPTVNWPGAGAFPMRFRVTVRDNRAGGGGVNTAGGNSISDASSIAVSVVNTGSVFVVSSQNSFGLNFPGNSSQTVSWNVAGTTGSGINTANVKISLSTNGGSTFDTVLAASTANDGTETITLPNPVSTQTLCRIKVEAVGNIFFDINNANFTITPSATPAPQVSTVTVNNGVGSQRSMVRSVEVTFNSQVNFAGPVASAFQIARFGGGNLGGFTATANVVGGVTVVTLNGFTGAETQFNSWADGKYQLTVFAANVSNAGGPMASNYTFGDATGLQGFTRMFGDWTGDRQVDNADIGAFSSTFGLSSASPQFLSAFDVNDDTLVDNFDFSNFSSRFGTILP